METDRYFFFIFLNSVFPLWFCILLLWNVGMLECCSAHPPHLGLFETTFCLPTGWNASSILRVYFGEISWNGPQLNGINQYCVRKHPTWPKWGFPGARPGVPRFSLATAAEEAAGGWVGSLNPLKCVCCRQNERLLPKQFCSYETQHSFWWKNLHFARKSEDCCSGCFSFATICSVLT